MFLDYLLEIISKERRLHLQLLQLGRSLTREESQKWHCANHRNARSRKKTRPVLRPGVELLNFVVVVPRLSTDHDAAVDVRDRAHEEDGWIGRLVDFVL